MFGHGTHTVLVIGPHPEAGKAPAAVVDVKISVTAVIIYVKLGFPYLIAVRFTLWIHIGSGSFSPDCFQRRDRITILCKGS